MYMDTPYAREVGHVGEAAGVASSAGVMEGHDVAPDVLTGVLHWLRKRGHPDETTHSMPFVAWCWRGLCIASTRGARLWDS